jgi:hypothetical protein
MKFNLSISHQLALLQILVWFKRSMRLLIRTMWMGICGYLLAWGLNELRGWFPEEHMWLWMGAVFAALPFTGILFSWPRRKRLVWSLDRKFELQEQVSTSWSVIKDHQGNRVTIALLTDCLHSFPIIWKRLLFFGWHLSRDVVALTTVLILGLGVYVYRFVPITVPSLDDVEIMLLPPLGDEASAKDIFPDGLLGLKPTPSPGQGGASGGVGSGDSREEDDMQMVQDALTELGKKLSQMAATYDLGQALQSGDTAVAASAMENLADQVDGLDDSTKEMLSKAMQSASDKTSYSGQAVIQKLSQDMDEVAEQLQPDPVSSTPPGDISTQDAMDEVASDFRALDDLLTNMPGQGAGAVNALGEKGGAEPAMRLQGEGGEFELETGESPLPGMLFPGDARTIGYQTSSEALNLIRARGGDIVLTPLIPSYYPWIWRDVVSTYFLNR